MRERERERERGGLQSSVATAVKTIKCMSVSLLVDPGNGVVQWGQGQSQLLRNQAQQASPRTLSNSHYEYLRLEYNAPIIGLQQFIMYNSLSIAENISTCYSQTHTYTYTHIYIYKHACDFVLYINYDFILYNV